MNASNKIFIFNLLLQYNMRFSVMSIKGGVGKSTISILLSIELNRLGKRLILVDMDLSGYTSFLAGIREPGIFSSIVDGTLNRVESYRDIENIRIIKLAGDGPRTKLDVSKIRSNSTFLTQFQKAYLSAISIPHDYSIIDNFPLSSSMDEESRLEREIYTNVRNDICYSILVTDSSDFDLNETLVYSTYLRKNNDPCVPFALVTNMIPSSRKQALEKRIIELMNRINTHIGILIPFIDDLFEYNGPINGMPRLSQLAELAKIVVNESESRENVILSF
ncbi:hypothetical protein DFR88_11605 [Metallosphaera sedula]|uniref:CobQ/CobB/MinD/ParA nucleotide binding domain-containing protein n=2 Tax=Sulfolobaceae TaxID=118883 RepID=A0A4D8RVV3_METPR|nr:hypothetical protein DFR88_11605 [Metallosphaera prunae]